MTGVTAPSISDTAHIPSWLGTCVPRPEKSGRPTSPFARRLVRGARRIVFACVAIDRTPITVVSTAPRGGGVAFRLSSSFVVLVVPGLLSGGLVRLGDARAPTFCRVRSAGILWAFGRAIFCRILFVEKKPPDSMSVLQRARG
jgi:hypothetical protein